MFTTDLEKRIFQDALKAFKENVAMPMEIDTGTVGIGLHHDNKADQLMKIFTQNTEILFYPEVKANVPNITLAEALLYTIKKIQLPYEMLLVTRYVTAQLAERLKTENIQFIDTAGNAYINQPPLYIYVKGNRLPEAHKPAPVKRAFKPTGLKLMYAFLCNPGLENRPYREIAATADVALGTVGWIMNDLKEMGYLLDMGKRGKKLVEREKIFKLWVTAYSQQLRPKLILGRFKGETDWWQHTKLNPEIAQWGGEVAAAKITPHLKPALATIYTERAQLNNFLIDNRLRKDPTGNIEVLERFWKPTKQTNYEETVNPLLVYADLLATGNQRNIETAKIIHEQYLIQLIRED